MSLDIKELGGQDKTVEESSRFNITLQGLALLLKKGLDLNHLYVLEKIVTQDFLLDQRVTRDWIQTLVRKGFLTTELQPTLKGDQLFLEVATGIENTVPVFTKKDDPFEKWWKEAYPDTDHFEYRGRVFPGVQSKKKEKELSRKYFWEGANELKIMADDIYWATIAHVEAAKEKSIQTGVSEITHIPNSERYLRQRCYLPFLEAGRQRRETPFSNRPDPYSHIV